MAVNSGEHLGRAVDLGGIHAADLGISSKEERRDAELGADSLGDMMDIEAARHAQEELKDADPAGARREKMTAFVDEHECRQEKKAPKDGADNTKQRIHGIQIYVMPLSKSHAPRVPAPMHRHREAVQAKPHRNDRERPCTFGQRRQCR